MAASSVRVCLRFENNEFENAWFFIDFSLMKTIADVSSCIGKRYFQTVPLSLESAIVLRLQNCLLLPCENVMVLRDGDNISVSFTQNCNKTNGDGSIQPVSNYEPKIEPKRKSKRKKNFVTIDEADAQKCPKRDNGKHQNKEPADAEKADGSNDDDKKEVNSIEKHLIQESMLTSPTTYEGAVKIEEPVTSIKNCTMTQLDETKTANRNESVKSKTRKRKRKHKRKTVNNNTSTTPEVSLMDVDTVDTTMKIYVGQQVKIDSVYYGAVPDKLENPKHYRHGYRNLNKYDVKPNKYKKFDSDGECELIENTEQYNFLRPQEERNKYSGDPSISVDKCKETSTELQYSRDNHTKSMQLDDNYKVNLTNSHQSHGIQNGSVVNVGSEYRSSDVAKCETGSQIYQYTAFPLKAYNVHSWSYSSDTDVPKQKYDKTLNSKTLEDESRNAASTILTRRLLSNGASVFTRSKNQQKDKDFYLSKQEQLDTKASNVSTIFVNAADSKLAVSSSPSINVPTCIETSSQWNGSHSNGSVDYSKLPVLHGVPKPGNKIAYKVLEISVDSTPEVSSYKVAEVLNVNNNQMVELKNILQSMPDLSQNKFHVEIKDDEEVLTNEVLPADNQFQTLSKLYLLYDGNILYTSNLLELLFDKLHVHPMILATTAKVFIIAADRKKYNHVSVLHNIGFDYISLHNIVEYT